MRISNIYRIVVHLAVGATVFAVAPASKSADFIGAKQVLDKVRQAASSTKSVAADPKVEQMRQLRKDAEDFRGAWEKMPPEEAAERWLGLWDRFWELSPASQPFGYPGSPSGVEQVQLLPAIMKAIPGPLSWESLSTKARARAEKTSPPPIHAATLCLLADFLDRGPEAALTSLDALEKTLKASDSMVYGMHSREIPVLRNTLRQMDRKGDVAKNFEAVLESGTLPGGPRTVVRAPDLVALVGEKQAEALILKALKTPGVTLEIPSGGQTLQLAKRVILEHIQDVNAPQWALVNSIDDVPLYEALSAKFGSKNSTSEVVGREQFVTSNFNAMDSDQQRTMAQCFYVLGLVAKDRIDDAVAFALSSEGEELLVNVNWLHVLKDVDVARLAPSIVLFCEGVMDVRPSPSFFNLYFSAALAEGDMDGLLRRLDALLKDPAQVGGKRRQLLLNKANVLLAIGNTDVAIDALREALRLPEDGPAPLYERAIPIVNFYKVGKLLERKDVSDEAVGLMQDAVGKAFSGGNPGNVPWEVRLFPAGLRDYGDLTDAERLQLSIQEKTLESLPAESRLMLPLFLAAQMSPDLIELTTIYHEAGRHADVLYLLENAPWWGAADLADLLNQGPDVAVPAAAALHDAGRDEQAVAILKHYLFRVPADDEAYALLVDIRGLDLIPWLDEVYARDRFEERPLIWKAHLLLKANRLEEAEATVRKALQVDPTDGEQKKGDRVRGYAVLAEILKAEGKAEDAAFFERVVKSVRIAEKGDTFTELGLLSRSRDLYGQAASEFADAYCVQWRLGERLYALGDVEGAKEHYRIAFERMPEQFGQVASFCFGCEGVFARRESRSVAETVFMHLAETMPDKPQVHFMLGQLRQAQGREAEAYNHYKDAVAKDPDYLDAWKKIRELQNDLFLPRAEMDPVVLRMFRLDPLNRHGSGDLRDVADMKKMWETVASVGKFSLATPKSLLALPESAKFIRELGQQNGLEMPEMTTMGMPGMPFEALELNPETALARHNVVQQILRIGGGSQYYL